MEGARFFSGFSDLLALVGRSDAAFDQFFGHGYAPECIMVPWEAVDLQALIDRHGASKVARYGYGLLAALLVIVTTLHCLNAVYYSFQGEWFRLISAGEDTVVIRDRHGKGLVMNAPNGTIDQKEPFTVTYAGKGVYGAWDRSTFGYMLNSTDGSSVPPKTPGLSISGEDNSPSEKLSASQLEELVLVQRLQAQLGKGNPIISHIGLGILGLLVLLLGVGLICYPDKFWAMQTARIVIGGEPTDYALFMNRVSGVIAVILAFVLPLAR